MPLMEARTSRRIKKERKKEKKNLRLLTFMLEF